LSLAPACPPLPERGGCGARGPASSTTRGARRSFKPLLEAAGLPDIRFHDLRHTFASIALGRGANINTVSKMLGHSSVKVTLDVYRHLMPGMQAAAREHLGGVFS